MSNVFFKNCSFCSYIGYLSEFVKNNKLLKSCPSCRVKHKKYKEQNKCIHSRRKHRCRECSNDPINITIKTIIYGSKVSDIKNNRYDEENFVNYNFLKNLITESNNLCYYCSNNVQYIHYNDSLATLERLDNLIGHTRSNCVIACRSCNYTRVGDRYILN